jgi:hypothetical protein
VQKTSCPGAKRKSGMQFSLDKLGYVGMGYDSTLTAINDIWAYDADLDTWTQKNDFPGTPRCWLSSTSMNGSGYVVTGYFLNQSVATKEFWKYNGSTDTWTTMPDFAGIARYTGSAFCVGGKLYNGLGYASTYLNDFWEFTPPGFSIDETIGNSAEMNIMPSPATDKFDISLNGMKKGNNTIVICDGLGKITSRFSIEAVSQLITVDCSAWTQGVYYVVLINGATKNVKKVVVK